ncbi:hypothetical protein WR25_09136 [Diploscapter pachys]|uniref:PABS domain-containing protein n=1 Tax=Diploscapter pachys TaxID=2018661 RepID=A0A2A2LI00_9BILA|nr:hypothetical protein WR25_09136 [Diploscapter pachys]
MDFVKINMTSVDILPITRLIAKSWFGFEETDTQRIIIQDGIEFIRNAAKYQIKYDVILIDVAGSQIENDDETVCPTPAFLKEETLENLQQMLLPNGTFIMDLIYTKHQYNETLNTLIKDRLLTYFDDCYQEFNGVMAETMMYCSFEKGNNPIENPLLFVQRYDKIRPLLSFRQTHLENLYLQWQEIKKNEALNKETSQTCNKNELLMAYRSLVTNDKGESVQMKLRHTEAVVECPIPLTLEDKDSRRWKVNKKYTSLRYPRQLIIGPFLTGTMQIHSDKMYEILLIGFAGGLIPNYISTMDFVKIKMTNVEILPITRRIATDWFGFVENDSQKLVIEDGVKFVDKAVKNGAKYDVILVDVVGSRFNTKTALISPPQAFIEPETLENLKTILGPNGTIIFNVLYTHYDKTFNEFVSLSVCLCV